MNLSNTTHPAASVYHARNQRWTQVLEASVERDWPIVWEGLPPLSREEAVRIASSIADFHRGESSEAKGYLAKSKAFSERVDAPWFHQASLMFVRAESKHSYWLTRFMQETGLPMKGHVPADVIFRWLRAGADLGWASRVVLVAELIAQLYYPSLRAATLHPALRRMCDEIVVDEAEHVQFQAERIAQLEAQSPAWLVRLKDRAQQILMMGTAMVVWSGHRRVLQSRFTFTSFVRQALRLNAWSRGQIQAERDRPLTETPPPAATPSLVTSDFLRIF